MALVGEEKEELKVANCETKSTEEAIPSDWLQCLKTSFGHSDFRPKQLAVIESILNDRRDNCFFTSSGYGKSLVYQFPPVYTDSIAIVVNPFISLIEDQIREIRSNDVRACYMGSAREYQPTLIDVIEGQYNLVYVSPEYITRDPGKRLLNKIGDKLTLIAIDEAHCISKWGHDFRPSYCQLQRVRLLCPGVPILALSATATPRVQEDIINGLALHEPQITRTSFDYPNLYLSAEPKSSIPSRFGYCYTVCSEIRNDIGPHIRATTTGSIIMHCITKNMTEYVARIINSSDCQCVIYHGGLSLKKRKKAKEDFISGRIRSICLTGGFGMAINRPDVRLVILYGAASSLESLYQKAGAAGRDGLPAKCLMFHSDKDWSLHERVRYYCRNTNEEEIQRKERLVEIMMKYVSNKDVCRRRYMLSYFGENCDEFQPRPDCCDICNG